MIVLLHPQGFRYTEGEITNSTDQAFVTLKQCLKQSSVEFGSIDATVEDEKYRPSPTANFYGRASDSPPSYV